MAEPSCPPDCGACCDPVVLPYTPRDVERAPLHFSPRDRRWIMEELRPISRRVALPRAPYLTQGGATLGIVDGVPVLAYSAFYECVWFDADTRRCTNYDDRPDACRDYPLYGQPAVPANQAIPTSCVYLPEPRRRVPRGATP